MILPPNLNDSSHLGSDQVHQSAEDVLKESFPEVSLHGYSYTQDQIWDVLLYASANRISIKAACERLENAPSYNWMYTFLADQLWDRFNLDQLEQRGNDALRAALPEGLDRKRHKLAIDLTLIPFYGDEAVPEVYRSQVKKSTTKFFCFASAYVIKKHKRVTVCCVFVRPGDSLIDVLTRLLEMVQELGIRIKRLYLDREFARVDVLSYVSGKPHTTIVAMPKKGKTMKSLQKGKKSYRVSYTMKSPTSGQITFPLWIACRYKRGKAGKHGIDYLFFAVLGPECKSTELELADDYRMRFGIEASYRIMNQARARTTSTKAQMRLLLVAIAFLLQNLWVSIKWALVLLARRRHALAPTFTLDLLCHFISARVEAIYGTLRLLEL